jgi:penicillin-binding protein 1C
MLAGPDCPLADTTAVPLAGAYSTPCTFHRTIHLDAEEKWRVTADCYDPSLIRKRSWFVLPPVQEYYYRSRHPEYQDLPGFAPGCVQEELQAIGLIYPKSDSPLFIPRNLEGQMERAVLKAAHRNAEAILYWHLDGIYLGETHRTHEMAISPEAGEHLLTLMDSEGNTLRKKLRIILR